MNVNVHIYVYMIQTVVNMQTYRRAYITPTYTHACIYGYRCYIYIIASLDHYAPKARKGIHIYIYVYVYVYVYVCICICNIYKCLKINQQNIIKKIK